MQKTTRSRAVFALAILLFCWQCASALDPSLDVNQYSHKAWTVRDGFFKSGIYPVVQTPDGYLWLGTQFGLFRFDGVRSVPWQPPPGQHLPSAEVFSLLAAQEGTLWIGTLNGLASWKNGKLTQYLELGGHYIFALVEDHDGTIWASGVSSSPNGGRLCAIRRGIVQCYGEEGQLGRGAFNLYEDSKGNLWAGVKNGLWRWSPGPPRFYPMPGEPDGIQALGEDANGTLLVGWKGGLYHLVDGQATADPLPDFTRSFDARRILCDRNGDLWIGTSSHGLLHVHQGRTDEFTQSDGLSGDAISALSEDREGNIWVATINGLDRFGELSISTVNVKQGLSNSLVEAVLAAGDGSVWLSTRGGLNRWNHGRVKTYRLGGKRGKPDELPNSLFQDNNGRIWVSTPRELGYIENDRFIPLPALPDGAVLAMTQDAAGNLWVANEHYGLFSVSPKNEARKISWADLGHKDYVSALAADPSTGGMWIGFFLGSVVYLADGQIRASYTTADGLGEGHIGSFHFDHDGTLWIATAGGLSRLKNGRIATLTSRNGLPCDSVRWAMEDDDHSFWLYMPCGLVRIAPQEMNAWAAGVDKHANTEHLVRMTVFDSADGVRGHVSGGYFNLQVAKTPDGKIWFLPWDGVSVFDPRHLPFNRLPPPVHVEQIVADGKTYDPSHGLRLPAQIHDLTIDYTALSFVEPEKIHFRYKLEGQDRDWREVVNDREVQYSNLAPGRYTFRVLACNNSGVWNEEGATLDFSIAPAYYQTLWFRTLCIVVFMALLWSLYQLRRRQLQQQFNMRLETRVNERTRIARELHDTLLQSFHGLMFRFQAARNMLPLRPQEAGQALDGAILRAEQAITESRGAIQGLRPAEDEHADLAQSLTAAGKELATGNGDRHSPNFEVIVEGERRKLSSALQDEVYRMGRELLQNAFQHARAREIEAEIRYGPRLFRLLVRDDGKGIDSNVLAQGGRPGHWGLPGIRERAQQIGAQVDLWSEAGAGTEIQLTVPATIAYEKTGHDSRSRFRRFRRKRRESE